MLGRLKQSLSETYAAYRQLPFGGRTAVRGAMLATALVTGVALRFLPLGDDLKMRAYIGVVLAAPVIGAVGWGMIWTLYHRRNR